MNKQTITHIDQTASVTPLNIFPRKAGDGITDGMAMLTFKITKVKTDSDNVATIEIEFLVTHYPFPDKIYTLGLASTMRVSDPQREIEKSLYSEPSLGLLTSIYKVNGEVLLKAYAEITEFEAKFDPKAQYNNEISWETASTNTKRIMEIRKNAN